jgi:RNA-directed DNA polymerase
MRIKARLAEWLAPRGLAFNEDKTRVVGLDEGFDFLGFNVRRYGTKPLITPSKAAVRRIRQRLRAQLRSLRGYNAGAVIRRLNPIIRGWAAYYRTQVSSKTFKALDQHLWALTYRWALLSHRNKSRPWVFARYFGTFNRSRQDRWVFGDRASGAYLHRFAWTGIVRHTLVRHRASPDDPDLTDYWTWRRRTARLPINKTALWCLGTQHGRCPICTGLLYAEDHRPESPHQWERWLAANRTTITTITTREAATGEAQHRLIHADCLNPSGTTRPAPTPTGPA